MWMKIDDGLHAHRKTRAVTKSAAGKARDAAPMGLWVLAGSWAAERRTDGWVPRDELDRWDDDWEALADRLVRSGYWWPQARDGEQGFGFTDWHDYNDPADMASKAGTFGNHVRWHVNEKRIDPECEHCPTEPDEPEDRGDIAPDLGGRSGGDIGGDSGGESHSASGAIALPVPDPYPTRTRTREQASRKALGDGEPERFEEFWETYSHKVGRKKAETAYRAALKKPGVTADLLVAAAAAYITWQMSEGKHPSYTKHPATWLNGEHWTDERTVRPPPQGRVGQHMALVRQLAANEAHPTIPQIGPSR